LGVRRDKAILRDFAGFSGFEIEQNQLHSLDTCPLTLQNPKRRTTHNVARRAAATYRQGPQLLSLHDSYHHRHVVASRKLLKRESRPPGAWTTFIDSRGSTLPTSSVLSAASPDLIKPRKPVPSPVKYSKTATDRPDLAWGTGCFGDVAFGP